jgi:hypothetical protein
MPVARIRLPLKPANRKADRVDHRFGDNQSGKRKAVVPRTQWNSLPAGLAMVSKPSVDFAG